MTLATILRIPNEPHMALVRQARRERGLWLPSGFPRTPARPLSPEPVVGGRA